MNNNKLDENALLAGCKGVFAKSSFITIGTKEYETWLSGTLPHITSVI